MSRPDYAREIRNALSDARLLCERLGLLADRSGYTLQPRGAIVRCPWHSDRKPSCSIRIAGDGTVAARCHSCGATGDALGVIAAVKGLSLKSDFRTVLRESAELAGLWQIVQELESGEVRTERPRIAPPRAAPEPERDYPHADELAAFWDACVPTSRDEQVANWLRGRSISAGMVDACELARALPADVATPRWASFQGRSWTATGHRLVFPMRDHLGVMRSVRAGRIVDGDSPKRLPPGGCKASGVVLANEFAVAMLSGKLTGEMAVSIVEGEPDFLTRASLRSKKPLAVLGIVSGSWSATFADRIPFGSQVAIETHLDRAGEAYAAALHETLHRRCFVRRLATSRRDG